MNEKKRIFGLVAIMAVACVAVTGSTIAVLYRTALQEQREVLVATAQSQARLIDAIYEFNTTYLKDHLGGPRDSTLDQLIAAHKQYRGIGETGEFTLAKRDGDRIVFLLSHRYDAYDPPKPVPFDSVLAEPMRLALSGLSGTIVGLDYRGVKVLAAYEPVKDLGWGIVAKIDVAELRTPFIKASIVAFFVAVSVILVGTILFLSITNPILKRLKEHSQKLMKMVESLQQSESLLQKSRDNLESRVNERTAELVEAKESLELEVHQRSLAEEKLQALWKIAEMVNLDYLALCDQILQGSLQITRSQYAFYGFLNQDESLMSIYSWSRDVAEECRIKDKQIDYPIDRAGIWAEAVRERKVLIVNDYAADHPGKSGIPNGHVPLTRILVVPVFKQNRIVALVAVANKAEDYNEEDAKQLASYAAGVQVIIDQRKTDLELKESEKECRILSRKIIEAEEIEKKRLAREIHDGVGQSLAAIKYRTESCYLTARQEDYGGAEELRYLIKMIQDTMAEMRKIHNDLHPAHIDELGLIKTLSYFCEEFQATYSNMKVKASIELSEREVPEYIQSSLFRIFQETMNNAARHSGADLIRFRLWKNKDNIELTIHDNGVGFDIQNGDVIHSKGKGLGLYSMQERAELSGGNLKIKSSPGSGTDIRVTWPCRDLI